MIAVFINPGDVTLMTVPGYPVFGTHAKWYGGEVHNLPLTEANGFLPDLDSIPRDVLKRAKTINDPKSILDAIVATDYKSMVGPVKWTGQPVKNVTKTPLVAGQWQRKNGKSELVIAENKTAPEIPVGGKLMPLS